MVDLVGVRTGKIDPTTAGATVPAKDWKYLLSARRAHCHDQFQRDCKQLLFFIDDGRANKFFGYPNEITYWREGLRLEPEAVPFAETYLRVHFARLEAGMDGKDWRAIPFSEAVKLGKRGPPAGNQNASKNKVDNINFVSAPKTKGGTGRDYILARLDRDGYAELAAQVRADELSANKAAIEAGFRKRPTSLERALKLLPNLTDLEWDELKRAEDQRRHLDRDSAA